MASQDIEWLLQEKYHGEKSDAFFADCKRLALGEPLAYLIGYTPFLDCTIWLDSRPLIPRPETEFWTKNAIEVITSNDTASLGLSASTPRILDLCAGSGCVGVAIAKAVPGALVDFSELEQAHLPTIQKNLEENGISTDRCAVFHTNLLENIPHTYDFIFSNPPYIDVALRRTDESVLENEPHLALFGGRGGMEIITQIIAAAPAQLRLGGQLWLEHEPEQSGEITKLAVQAGFSCTTYCDQYQVERYSILVLQ